MNALVLLVAASAVGVDVGWMTLSEGGVEYIIQIEPELVDTLLKKQDLESEIPPGLDVRRFRVTVGAGKLPRQSPPAGAAGGRRGAGQPTTAAGPPTGGAPPAGAAPVVAPIPGAGTPAGGPGAASPLGPPGGFQPGAFPPATPGGAAPPGGAPTRGPGAGGSDPVPFGDAGASINTSGAPIAGAAIPLGTGASAAPGAFGLGVAGPNLGSPAVDPVGKNAREAVSRVFDDPNAPGRAAGADTGQPHLTQEEMLATRRMGNDFSNGGAGNIGAGGLLASAHEMNRPSEFERGGNQNGMAQANGFGQNGNNGNANGGRGFNNSNERSPGDRSENFSPAGANVARASEPAEKPWPTLIFTVTLLLASVSLNFYLGWVAWDSRFRYRELLTQTGDMPLAV